MHQVGPNVSVVVPAVGTAGSLSVVRSLGRKGIHTIGVSERENPPSFSSRYCHETRRVPAPSDDITGYRDALLALARREDVKAIIPVREADIYVLSRYRDAFSPHLQTPWPTFSQLGTVHDRIQLVAAAERADVSVPDTVLLDDVDDWNQERIIKGRYALLTADNVDAIPEDQVEAPPKTIFLHPGVEPDIDAITESMGHTPIAQAYVDGTEYCLRALYDEGEVVATSQKKLIRGYKYSRGPSVYHEAVDIPALETAGIALLDELDWNGLASVGFIRDDSGEFNLLEINPRVPASLPVDIHAGVDYPHYWWQLACGESIDEPGPYRVGTASHLLRGELVHLHSMCFDDYPLVERPSITDTVVDISTSLVSCRNFDCLSLDDPRPFVRDVLNTSLPVFSVY